MSIDETSTDRPVATLPLFARATAPAPVQQRVHHQQPVATLHPGPVTSAPGLAPAVGSEAIAAPAHVAPRPRADRSFWQLVTSLRGTVAERLAMALQERALVAAEREELGRDLIEQVIRDHNQALASAGEEPWTREHQQRVSHALFDAVFRMGRLQPLVERTDVVNIELYGASRVILQLVDGSFEEAEPVADSDADLVDFLNYLAQRDTDGVERSFSRANPFLEMPLPGRARLASANWVTDQPYVTIRLQNLKNVALPDLRRLGEIDLVLEQFLSAAVRARKSIVVAGQGQGSGKTTLLRALASQIDPWEKIATIETDYELYLHLDTERHKRVVPFQTRPGTGEQITSGLRAGAITTSDEIEKSLRHNLERVIVGEVRGPEIVAMFEAMQMGNGSLSTVHADSAVDVIERLVGLAAKDRTLSESYTYRQIAQTIDLIVFLSNEIEPGGYKRRFVSEIIEVNRGDVTLVTSQPIFAPNERGRAVPVTAPTFIDDLVRVGFDRSLLTLTDGTWTQEVQA